MPPAHDSPPAPAPPSPGVPRPAPGVPEPGGEPSHDPPVYPEHNEPMEALGEIIFDENGVPG
jgi:hypothetical protein